ncbi:hypothetical protein CPKG_00050 [Cyanophage KBS-S-2A]|uniref:hypothetical protein n=1 Tax=Cyanophage KBS-S-2A TaxID=889953 RepID=UPI0002C18125|nr:hypothetical protein CPKG_00050 [Cyanophage KBS-S-2A]AGH57681.1 hypothetical protein CPKG_00050 [Cyanophage KBS-S-2A]
MTLVWRPGFQFDADASTYIEAVEAADTQALETGVRYAINDFVIGCKNDGIWDAIKASCILAGARTLSGALVPLVGTAPTNFNFVSGDYDRETGLKGNGSTKYLDSNRTNNADPQNSKHLSTFVTQKGTNTGILIGTDDPGGGSRIVSHVSSGNSSYSINTSSFKYVLGTGLSDFVGASRSSSVLTDFRYSNGLVDSTSDSSETPSSLNVLVFRRNNGFHTNARLAFYSIGESLDLAALDTRVSNLITAIGAAIP